MGNSEDVLSFVMRTQIRQRQRDNARIAKLRKKLERAEAKGQRNKVLELSRQLAAAGQP